MENLFKIAVVGYREFLQKNSAYSQLRSDYIERINQEDQQAVMEFAQMRIRYRLQFLDFIASQHEIVDYLKTLPEREKSFSFGDEPQEKAYFSLNDQDQLVITLD